MIATLTFEPSLARVRRARFVRRPNVPLDAACVVANGVREALRALLGEAVTATIGEPVALDAPAWRALLRDAFAFVVPGRATDVVFVVPRRDARVLVRAAFGEETQAPDGAWSALEEGAIERIIARCAVACDALCVERRGPTRAVDPARLPPCAAFFDVRIGAPAALTLGVGIVRELPETAPVATLSPGVLAGVALDARVTLGYGKLKAPRLLELRPGDVVVLGTKVDGEGELNLAGQRIAQGICGARHGWAAFEVRSMRTRGDAW